MHTLPFISAGRWPIAGWFLFSALVCVLLVCGLPVAAAQDGRDESPDDTPPPEDLTLKTADGVQLAATFYPGTKAKETVPIILLHMFKRSGNDYSELAPLLQSLGHAVLVPDLRGHGDSTQRRKINRTTGKVSTDLLEAASMGKNEFTAMVTLDMPALKQFLIEKNNAGELNIEKLCVVGAEMGASVAANWAYFDWSRPPEGNKKMGQDVKSLVLISPEWSTPGLPLRTALVRPPLRTIVYDPQLKRAFKDPDGINFRLPVLLDFRKEVSVFIAVGKGNSRALRDATRLKSMLKPHHPQPASKAQQDLFFGTLDTSLQGTRMLGVRGLDLEKYIGEFINRRAVKRSFPWAKRTDPYDRG